MTMTEVRAGLRPTVDMTIRSWQLHAVVPLRCPYIKLFNEDVDAAAQCEESPASGSFFVE